MTHGTSGLDEGRRRLADDATRAELRLGAGVAQIADEAAAAVTQERDEVARRALEAMDTTDMQVDLALDTAKNAVQLRPSPS